MSTQRKSQEQDLDRNYLTLSARVIVDGSQTYLLLECLLEMIRNGI